jgi:hypothetical protein
MNSLSADVAAFLNLPFLPRFFFVVQVSEDAINDIPDNSDEIQDLERELQRLKTERRKVEIPGKIEEEKEDLKKLQHPPKANSLANSISPASDIV